MKNILKSIVVTILTIEAKRVLKKFRPKVVAVTGSVGKTGTKDAIFTIISHGDHARKSEKSFNSEIGVPLTVLGLPNAWSSVVGWLENLGEGFLVPWRNEPYPAWLILEVGADRPGDIRRMHWLKPSIVVFTRFPDVPVHVEFFESPEEVIAEKRELKKALAEDGTLIVNADDPKMARETVEAGQHLISYGFATQATVRGNDYEVSYNGDVPVGVSFTVTFQDTTQKIILHGVLGKHHAYPILAAIAVGIAEGKKFEDVLAALAEYMPTPGRMRILAGMNRTVIIDDSYNSSPIALEAGINTLAGLHTHGRTIAMLGDMLELGDFSVTSHRRAGEQIATVADILVTVGVRMRNAAEATYAAHAKCSRIESFQTAKEAGEFVKSILQEGDLVYVKGSQGTRMEHAIERILLEPREAVKALVRQDPHWKTEHVGIGMTRDKDVEKEYLKTHPKTKEELKAEKQAEKEAKKAAKKSGVQEKPAAPNTPATTIETVEPQAELVEGGAEYREEPQDPTSKQAASQQPSKPKQVKRGPEHGGYQEEPRDYRRDKVRPDDPDTLPGAPVLAEQPPLQRVPAEPGEDLTVKPTAKEAATKKTPPTDAQTAAPKDEDVAETKPE